MTDATSGTGRVFGIDLGTTYSAIAYIDETGRPTVCRNDNSAEITPSVVHFETPDNVVVGETAKQSAFIDADNVVKLIKRRMGDEIELEFHGKAYTPESISALILKRLAADAAAHTQGPVEQAVITVPAYFGVRQKEATQKAGLIAGLDVVGVLPEPVAAAVHYDLTSGGADKTVLVYDLGGGTFDTTVIEVRGKEITVVCTDGATNLGGANWDERLSEHVLARFVETARPEEPPQDDDEFLQEVAIKVEDLKKQLSLQESRSVQLRFAGAAAKIDVTRAEFESMTADLLDRSAEIVKRTLAALEEKAPGTRIDEVLLVGGSTKMPMVADRLTREFGWTPKLHDPDLAVAKGAALWGLSRVVYRQQQEAQQNADTPEQAEEQAAEVVRRAARDFGMSEAAMTRLTDKQTTSVLPKAFGIKLQDNDDATRDYVFHLAHANDELPVVDRHLPAQTTHSAQTQVQIELYEQAGAVADEELAANNRVLNVDGTGLIRGIPPQPPGQTAKVDILLSVDVDGLLKVTATERGTGQNCVIEVNVGLTAAEVSDAIDAVSKISVSS
ncbi:Hsp70 family protein [Pseudonocardia sp. ICBG1034]|uniref:Hsp70 family protein n=1 Tax=Pseudonocardia sp. ICBG1034 TaxID=2844381 RepID=UPI001CCE97A2|nr:Hsp70 family protein [Pseudonocardia sp. ICBG1034]